MWSSAAEVLREQVSDSVWMTTFAEVVPDEVPGGLRLSVPNRWTKERIEERHLDAVRAALADVGHGDSLVLVEVQAAAGADDLVVADPLGVVQPSLDLDASGPATAANGRAEGSATTNARSRP